LTAPSDGFTVTGKSGSIHEIVPMGNEGMRWPLKVALNSILQELSNSPFPKRLRDEQAYWIRLTVNPGELKGV
jgi:hypothetical protein